MASVDCIIFKEFSPPQHIRNNNPDPQCLTVICLIAATMERKTAQYNHPINLVYSIAQIFSFVNTFSLFLWYLKHFYDLEGLGSF